MMQEVPHTGEFSYRTLIKLDGTPPMLAEVRGEEIVFNGEFDPFCWRAVDIGPLGEDAGTLHQSIWSSFEEVLVITLSSGFKTPATQAGTVLYLGELSTVGLPQLSDNGWVVPRISTDF